MKEGKIFFCSRHDDEQWPLFALSEHLRRHGPDEQLFIDHRSIAGGDSWHQDIKAAIAGCDVFLALIGPSWATPLRGATPTNSPMERANLEFEIKTALARSPDLLIIPVLIGDAATPSAETLGALGKLIEHRAARLRPPNFYNDGDAAPAALEKRRAMARFELDTLVDVISAHRSALTAERRILDANQREKMADARRLQASKEAQHRAQRAAARGSGWAGRRHRPAARGGARDQPAPDRGGRGA